MASEGDKYITSGVWLRCDKGGAPGTITVLPKAVKLYGQDWAAQLDAVPLVNIPSFGACLVTGTTCAPLTALWTDVMETVSVQGQKPLLGFCLPVHGGRPDKIYFTQQAALAATAPGVGGYRGQSWGRALAAGGVPKQVVVVAKSRRLPH